MAVGTIDDLIKLMQEQVELAKSTDTAQRAVEHIMKNPDLKTGSAATAAGRWWERMRTWNPVFGSMQKQGGGRLGSAWMNRQRQKVADSRLGKWFSRQKKEFQKRGIGGMLGRIIGGRKGAHVGAKVGAAVGTVAAIGIAFNEARKAVAGWTDAMLESSRRLAEVSGSMAAVFAEKEVRDLLRDIRVGEATAGSTRILAESEAKRKDAEADISIALTNTGNLILAAINEVIAVPLQIMASVARPINEAVQWLARVGRDPDKPIWGEEAIAALKKEVDAAEARAGDIMKVMRAKAAAFAPGDRAAVGGAKP